MTDIKETVSQVKTVGYVCDMCSKEKRGTYGSLRDEGQGTLYQEAPVNSGYTYDSRSADLCPSCSDKVFAYIERRGGKIQYD